MDTITNERILQTLLDFKKDRPGEISAILLKEVISDLSIEEIESSFVDLKEIGLITLNDWDNTHHAILTPKAYGYFREKLENQRKFNEEKWATRKWSLLQTGLGYLLGFISAFILMWLKQYLQW